MPTVNIEEFVAEGQPVLQRYGLEVVHLENDRDLYQELLFRNTRVCLRLDFEYRELTPSVFVFAADLPNGNMYEMQRAGKAWSLVHHAIRIAPDHRRNLPALWGNCLPAVRI